MARIEFTQPKPRIQDWRLKLDRRTIGSVWRAAEGRHITSVSSQVEAPTPELVFKLARKMAKTIAAA